MRLSAFSIACLLFLSLTCAAQRDPEMIFMPSIQTVKLNGFGDQIAYPVIGLNSNDKLELNFDDLDADVKYYYYTFELRNADWTPAQMSFFDYVKGFTQVRINTYRNSSQSLTRYTHYQATLPDRNSYPTKSGNYVLKVFVNGDTSKLAFTKRFLVVDSKLGVGATVLQPSGQQYFQTHHRLQVQVSTRGLDVRYPQQQLKLNILQNYRWDDRLIINTPTFLRQEMVQYNNEMEMLMPAGQEWRWLNLRSFRLLGDRVAKQGNTDSSFNLFVKEEGPRPPQRYIYFNDINGRFINETTENINPYWNADYATVNFTYIPLGGKPYKESDLYIIGEISNYGKNPDARLKFNTEMGRYEGTMLLKQGYYDYMYALKDAEGKFLTDRTESNQWQSENAYLILVYFRELGGRYDQLLGFARVNSQFNRPGAF